MTFNGVSSTATGSCNTTATSNVLSCTNVADFAVGDEIRINKAGAFTTFGQPSGLTVVACGGALGGWPCAPGSTTYAYTVASLGPDGSIGAPIAEVTISNGPSNLSSLQFNRLTWTAPVPAPASYLILGRTSAGRVPLGIATNTNWFDYGVDNVFGQNTLPVEPWLPSVNITSGQRGWLRATITNISGSSITLSTPAGATLTNAVVHHENTSALVSALASDTAVSIPCGDYAFSGEQINIPNGRTISGVSDSCTRLYVTGGVLGRAFLRGDGLAQVAIEHVSLDLGNHAQASLASAFSCGDCDAIRVSDSTISRFQKFGIAVFGGEPVIQNNTIELEHPYLSQNQCINIASTAVVVTTNASITGNTCIGSGMWMSMSNGLVSSNEVHSHRFGTGIGIASDSTATGNVIEFNNVHDSGSGRDTNFTGISCYEIWGPGTVIDQNIGHDCYDRGLKLGALNATVTGNEFFDNGSFVSAGAAGILCHNVNASFNCSGSHFDGNNTYNTGTGTYTQNYGFQAAAGLTGLTFGTNTWSGAIGPISGPVPPGFN